MRNKRNIKLIIAAVLTAFILAVLPAAGTLATDTFTPKYSDDELNKIYEEIVAEYMGNDVESPAVWGVGVGGTMIDGEAVGFGESGLEKRVVVKVRYQNFEEFKKLFADKYGDAVYVEYTQSSKDEYDSQNYMIDQGAATDTTQEQRSDVDTGRATGTSAKTQIIAGAVLAAAAAAAVVLYLKKKK